jgi:hypothetical protein
MMLKFQHGKLYVDNVKFCKYEEQNGNHLRPGSYAAEARYAHAFGKLLPYVDGVGWIGSDAGVQIILGHVHSRVGLIPDGHLVRVLVDAIETHADAGEPVLAEVV